ncbi:hypothetical protein D3C81_1802820 [compost metagenome]
MRAARHQKSSLAGVTVVQIQLTGIVVAVDADDDLLAVAAVAGEVDHLAFKCRRQRSVDIRIRVVFVDQLDGRRAGFGDDTDQGVFICGPDHPRDFSDRVLEQSIERTGGCIQSADRGGNLVVVLGSVDRPLVGGADHIEMLTVGFGSTE